MNKAHWHFYAVRYKAAKDQIRIERAATPADAAALCFGSPMPAYRRKALEYKDLGTHNPATLSDAKRIAIIKDTANWIQML